MDRPKDTYLFSFSLRCLNLGFVYQKQTRKDNKCDVWIISDPTPINIVSVQTIVQSPYKSTKLSNPKGSTLIRSRHSNQHTHGRSFSGTMNISSPIIHQIDTRQNPTLTVFDGSREDECKLAKQFWNSVVLMPPVESTLVCKEIKQRTRQYPLDDKSNKPRFSSAVTKALQEKSVRDNEYEENAALKEAEDEGKRIQAARERHQQLRQLFFKQARTNRLKHQEWAIPHINDYPMSGDQYGTKVYYAEENDDGDDDDRQLVCCLPD